MTPNAIPILPSTVDHPSVLRPLPDVFARRAARLRQLADGHAQAGWLGWTAQLAQSQQEALLAVQGQAGREDWAEPVPTPAALRELLALCLRGLPDTPLLQDARGLGTGALALRLERNRRHALGEPLDRPRDGLDVLVCAAWQVQATSLALARPLPAAAAVQAHCPCCGSLAHASVLQAGDGKAGLRYQECCLCAARWHAVRARCTVCDDGEVVNYLSLEAGSGTAAAVAAETCDACHGYAKVCFQTRDVGVEPLADDLATLALDVLVGEQGYGRGAPNLLLCEGELA